MPNPTYTGTSYQRTQIPEWQDQKLQQMAARAYELGHSPYAAGPSTVRAPSREYQRLLEGQGLQQNIFQPFGAQSQGMFNGSAAPFNADEVSAAYMSPYTTGAMNRIAVQARRALAEQLMPELTSRFIGAGRFGGLSHQQAQERILRDVTEQAGSQQNELLHNAWGQALNQHNTQRQMQRQAGEGLANLGRYSQASHLADFEAKRGLEAQLHDYGQQEQTYKRQEFERAAADPAIKLAQMSAALQGMPVAATTFSHHFPAAPAPNPSTLGQVGALAGQLYGMHQMGQGRKRGGLISAPRMPSMRMPSNKRRATHPGLSPRRLSKLSYGRL